MEHPSPRIAKFHASVNGGPVTATNVSRSTLVATTFDDYLNSLKPQVKPITVGDVTYDVPLYTIGQLAACLGRTVYTMRKWENTGILPKSPLIFSVATSEATNTEHAQRRMYTKEMIIGIHRILTEEGCADPEHSHGIRRTRVPQRLKMLFDGVSAQLMMTPPAWVTVA